MEVDHVTVYRWVQRFTPLLGTVFWALAIGGGRGDGTARSRVRTRRGQWLVCHASCLHDADGSLSAIALVVEPAQAARSPRSSSRPTT